jgi:hypothetical protein
VTLTDSTATVRTMDSAKRKAWLRELGLPEDEAAIERAPGQTGTTHPLRIAMATNGRGAINAAARDAAIERIRTIVTAAEGRLGPIAEAMDASWFSARRILEMAELDSLAAELRRKHGHKGASTGEGRSPRKPRNAE